MGRNIVWDWNGTLLNDVQLSLEVINAMLLKHALPPVTLEQYHTVFGFPVKDYYKKIGFDFNIHNWDALANEYIQQYLRKLWQAPLHHDVIDVLTLSKKLGYKNYILSAMEQSALEGSLKDKNIKGLFDFVAGISDHKAQSKIYRGKELFSATQTQTNSSVFVGDTLHDFEVAQYFNAPCILVCNGHHPRHRLSNSGALLANNLTEALKIINTL